MNYKIILGISTVTILTLIYQYIKNIFNPNKRLLEGQISTEINPDAITRRYGGDMRPENNNSREISKSGSELVDSQSIFQQRNQTRLLRGLYDELGEFNHIYQERLFESLIPTQIKKTIVHLSSVDHTNNTFDLASTKTSGLSGFKNVVNFKLLSAQIPYVPHNIYNSTINGAVTNNFKLNSSNDISINEGYYTIYSLINTINNNLTSNISLTFNNITKFITINNPDGETIIIDVSLQPLFKRLGFENITSSNHNTITAKNIPDLSIHFIDIVYTNVHPRAATQTTDDGNILKRIPLNGQPGDMIYYDTPHSDYISQELFNPDINSNISNIELQFKRNDGSLYDFKGLHYDLKIEVTELVEPTLLNELASHMRRDRERFIDNEGSVEIGGIDYVLGNMDTPQNNNTR